MSLRCDAIDLLTWATRNDRTSRYAAYGNSIQVTLLLVGLSPHSFISGLLLWRLLYRDRIIDLTSQITTNSRFSHTIEDRRDHNSIIYSYGFGKSLLTDQFTPINDSCPDDPRQRIRKSAIG